MSNSLVRDAKLGVKRVYGETIVLEAKISQAPFFYIRCAKRFVPKAVNRSYFRRVQRVLKKRILPESNYGIVVRAKAKLDHNDKKYFWDMEKIWLKLKKSLINFS